MYTVRHPDIQDDHDFTLQNVSAKHKKMVNFDCPVSKKKINFTIFFLWFAYFHEKTAVT